MTPPPTTINWSYCLQRCNQNATLAKQLLTLLAKELPAMKSRLENTAKTNNTTDMAHLIHQLNGAAASAGAQTLANTAGHIERQLANQTTAPTHAELKPLLQCIDASLADIHRIAKPDTPN